MVLKTRRLRLHVGASRVHRWLALIVGIQVLIWFGSGLVMSVLPIGKVRGEHLVDKTPGASLPPELVRRLALAKDSRPLSAIAFGMMLDRPVAALNYTDGRRRLVDVATGNDVRIDARMAERIARAAYKGAPARTTTRAVGKNSTEYRGTVPAWRVDFDDGEGTRVYVDPTTGRIAAVRTGTWRLYDFFWGLHIMDWKNHENFNSPWIIAFAAGGLLLGIAGSVLLYMRWPRRRRRHNSTLSF